MVASVSPAPVEAVFRCPLRTRGYELDAEGLIPASTLLRYAEQVRWQAYAAQAAEFTGLSAGARSFVIAAERLEVLAQLSYDVALEGLFWLAKVGRTSLEFVNLLCRAEDGATVARVRVTAVHIGLDRRPAPVPEGVRRLARGDLDQTFAFLPPLDGEPPPTAFAHPVTARFSDMDLMAHVNHAVYLAWFDDARRAAPQAGGRLVTASLDYREQAVARDRLTALVWPLGERRLGATLRRESDGATLCRAQLALSPAP